MAIPTIGALSLLVSEPSVVALTIAGSDSGGGAGIQADIKTMAALGVFATTAVTAVTAQNTAAVRDVYPVPEAVVAAQVQAVVAIPPAFSEVVGEVEVRHGTDLEPQAGVITPCYPDHRGRQVDPERVYAQFTQVGRNPPRPASHVRN